MNLTELRKFSGQLVLVAFILLVSAAGLLSAGNQLKTGASYWLSVVQLMAFLVFSGALLWAVTRRIVFPGRHDRP